jgi:hypothetical protein
VNIKLVIFCDNFVFHTEPSQQSLVFKAIRFHYSVVDMAPCRKNKNTDVSEEHTVRFLMVREFGNVE